MFSGRRRRLAESVMKDVTKLLVLTTTVLVGVIGTTVPASADPAFSNEFDVRVNKLAEASGTIKPDGVVLMQGTFNSDLPVNVPGAKHVAAGASTTFSATLLPGDAPFYEKQARMEFAYRIVDKGRETGQWVGGLSTNHRGIIWFSPDGRCAIYDDNPLRGGMRLDDTPPVEGTPYTCSAQGSFLHGPGESDNVHFDATFVVKKK